MLAIPKIPKNPKTYNCELCDYNTCNKKDFTKHISTQKHQNASLSMVGNDLEIKNPQNPQNEKYMCSFCNRTYKDNSGLWKHKKKCVVNETQLQPLEINALTTLVLELVKSNQELQQQMIEVCKKDTTTNNNNTATNCNNKSFNLQFFLNETCKDALNMKDFIDSIQIKLSDLENMGKLGFVNGLSNIIIERLNALDVHMRPIHCTDTKRDTVYTKEKDQWTKEEADLKTVRRFIQSVAKKNTQNIGLFRNKHPDCMDSSSRNSDIYNKIVMETYGGYGNNDTDSENKIIMKLVKEIAIDKYR
jgi:hypothetical protein